MKCSQCGGTNNKAYIILGSESICNDCASKTKGGSTPSPKNDGADHTQYFTQYICKTHKCGTPNVNQLSKHLMSDCQIYEKVLPMWHKPKTFGGHNGDISRKYFKSINDVIDILLRRWNVERKNARIAYRRYKKYRR